MTKKQTIIHIKKQLQKLNNKIDTLIIGNQSHTKQYKNLTTEHKRLLYIYNSLTTT